MQKRAFIIHGWGGSPSENWFPWLRKQLEGKGIAVTIHQMPDPSFPNMHAWVKHLSKTVGTLDENCFFVGHSLGAIAILRYLETLSKDQEVGGCIFVAGFTKDLGIPEIANFFTTPIDFAKIKKRCKKFVAIASDNNPYVSVDFADMFKEKLSAKIIVEPNMGHFNDFALPVVFDEISQIIKTSEKMNLV